MITFDYDNISNIIFNGCKELEDPLSDTQKFAIRSALFGVHLAICREQESDE